MKTSTLYLRMPRAFTVAGYKSQPGHAACNVVSVVFLSPTGRLVLYACNDNSGEAA